MKPFSLWTKDVRTSSYTFFGSLIHLLDIYLASKYFTFSEEVNPLVNWLIELNVYSFFAISSVVNFFGYIFLSYFLLSSLYDAELWNFGKKVYSFIITFRFSIVLCFVFYVILPESAFLGILFGIVFLRFTYKSFNTRRIYTWGSLLSALRNGIEEMYISLATARPLKKLRGKLGHLVNSLGRALSFSKRTIRNIEVNWVYFLAFVFSFLILPFLTVTTIYYFNTAILHVYRLTKIEVYYKLTEVRIAFISTFLLVIILVITMSYISLKLASKAFKKSP